MDHSVLAVVLWVAAGGILAMLFARRKKRKFSHK
jgi:hypothetical protein